MLFTCLPNGYIYIYCSFYGLGYVTRGLSFSSDLVNNLS